MVVVVLVLVPGQVTAVVVVVVPELLMTTDSTLITSCVGGAITCMQPKPSPLLRLAFGDASTFPPFRLPASPPSHATRFSVHHT